MTFRHSLGLYALGVVISVALLPARTLAQGCAKCLGAPPCESLCTTAAGAGDIFVNEVCDLNQCAGLSVSEGATCGEGEFSECVPLQACCMPGVCLDLSRFSCLFAGGVTRPGQPCVVAGEGGICPEPPAPAPAVSRVGMLGALAALLVVAAVAVVRQRRA